MGAALAVIDPTSREKIADIRLKAHPESFQINSLGQRIYVNVPDAHQIAVIDSSKNQQTEGWAPEGLRATFPLAIDPITLKLDEKFEPCPIDEAEEMYPNGIFRFNITRLLAFLDADPPRFPIERVALSGIPHCDDSHLDKGTIRSADLSRPILLAEISPGFFSVIDGNHRVAKARRDGVSLLPARRIRCPDRVQFLTSIMAYQKYVEYWNSKVNALRPVTRRKPRLRTQTLADKVNLSSGHLRSSPALCGHRH